MFATAAMDNIITLWDLRQSSPICRYSDHSNRRESVRCEFSPCLKFLSTGSEDNSCYIYDIRRSSGKDVIKISNVGRDCVTAVAFHPQQPQMCTSSLDGKIKFYFDSTWNVT